MVEAPRSLCTASSKRSTTPETVKISEISRKEPLAVYDYLHIRAEEQATKQPHFAQQCQQRQQKNNFSPSLPTNDNLNNRIKRSQSTPRFPIEPPPIPDWIVSQLPPGVKKENLRWDPYGGGFYLPPEFQPKGQVHPPPLPPRTRSSSSERLTGGQQQQTGPPQFAPLPAGISKKIEEVKIKFFIFKLLERWQQQQHLKNLNNNKFNNKNKL
jgi:hypothetical protein